MGDSVTLEVIGAGFGRTGTLSLKVALEELGFAPCEHMTEIFGDGERIARWDEAARAKERGEPFAWERLFGGYRATVDWPGAYFWREMAAAYPEAKVILTTRDPARWYESARSTIYRPYELRAGGGKGWRGRAGHLLFELLGRLAPSARRGGEMVERVIWRGTFDGRFGEREHALDVFRRHNEAVRSAVPAERLLVFEVKEGWEPLCHFLDVPVPTTPFPHLNDTADFQRMIRRRFLVPAAVIGGGLAAVLGAALVAIRRRAGG